MTKKLMPWKKKTEGMGAALQMGVNPFEMLHREVNGLFDDFLAGFNDDRWLPAFASERFGFPVNTDVEVSETDEEVTVRVELPGMKEDEIEINMESDLLTITGEKKKEKAKKKRKYHFSEVSYGRFQRSIPLPEGLDRGRAKARLKRGVLTITLPKTEEAKAARRQIAVAAG